MYKKSVSTNFILWYTFLYHLELVKKDKTKVIQSQATCFSREAISVTSCIRKRDWKLEDSTSILGTIFYNRMPFSIVMLTNEHTGHSNHYFVSVLIYSRNGITKSLLALTRVKLCKCYWECKVVWLRIIQFPVLPFTLRNETMVDNWRRFSRTVVCTSVESVKPYPNK